MKLKLLDARHPSYDPDFWAQCEALYKGGRDFKKHIESFLPQNPSELSEIYEARKREASYRSYVGAIVDYYVAWLFSGSFSVRAKRANKQGTVDQGQESVDPDAYYAEFREDIGGDVDFADFIRGRVTQAQIKERSHWLIEMYDDGGDEPTDRAEWERRGLGKCSLRKVDREALVDYECDKTGKLKWCIIHSCEEVRPDPRAGSRDQVVETWQLYDDRFVETYELRYTKNQRPKDPETEVPAISRRPHRCKEVPLITLSMDCGNTSLWIIGRTFDPQVEHFKVSSANGWLIRRTCYAMPVINVEDDKRPPVMGAGYYMMLGLNEKYQWSGPPSAPFDVLAKEVDSERDEIFRMTHQMALGLDNNADTVGRSADSKEIDGAATRVMLNALGTVVSKAIEETYEVLSDARGDTDVYWSVEGFHGYDTATLGSLIATATDAQLLGIPSKTWRREIKTKVALASVPEAEQNVKDLMRSEIRNAIDKAGDIEEFERDPMLDTKIDVAEIKAKSAEKVATDKAKSAEKIAKSAPKAPANGAPPFQK